MQSRITSVKEELLQKLATKEELSEVKNDITVLKQDIAGLKQDVAELKKDVSSLKRQTDQNSQAIARLTNKVITIF